MGKGKLTKHQRRMLKNMQKKEAMQSIEKKNTSLQLKITPKKVAVLIAIAAAALIGYWLFYLPDAPSIQATPESINLGNVSVAAGTKSVSFSLSNPGKSDLVVSKIVTSCMCTSASMEAGGQASPRFGMHDSGAGWQQVIKPGESAVLKVYYDPTVHPDLRGPVTRTISLTTNDPLFTVRKLTIYVNQVA